MKEKQTVGYLPDECPPIGQLILYAIQQVIVMFPATITVALLTGFHISTTIFASGLATICFLFVTKRKLPLYYGSSFSYLPAIIGLMSSASMAALPLNDRIAYAQFGIIMSGFVSIIAGLIVNRFGKDVMDKILPASITGPIAMVIGLTLAGNALSDICSVNGATAIPDAVSATATNWAWVVGLITLFTVILASNYLKGFLGQLPLLIGPIVGCLAAYAVQLITGISLFRVLPESASSSLFALPIFTLPKVSWLAVAAIMPIAIATIPESTAHVYQLDIYVNDLAKKKGSKKHYDIEDKLGLNLIGDGIGDMVSAFVGGPAGTNYGENISAMAITKVFSVPVLMAAAVIAMIVACFSPLVNTIYALPQAVIGGLEVFLFGAIAAQGMAIMIEKKVDMFSTKNIAVIAVIMIIGIGGQYAFNGSIPFFGADIPCVAGAAVFGILLNLLLSIGSKE